MLYYRIDDIVKQNRYLDVSSEERHVDIEHKGIMSHRPSLATQQRSISFFQFLEHAMKIIKNNPELNLKTAKIFLNGGNAMHMAVELCHPDYIKYFAVRGVPANEINAEGNTPFFIAVTKKNKLIKLKLLKLIKDANSSPMLSFS